MSLPASPLRVAAAQCPAAPGDVQRNLQTHLRFVHAAARLGVQVLLFPELSLMGYEPDLLAAHVMDPSHPALQALQQAARDHRMALVVGGPAAPLAAGAHPAIGAWMLEADGRVALYRKRHLHTSEECFASPGADDALVLPLAGEPVGLAVCADLTHAAHAQAARAAGATLYAAGALISANGYPAESALLQGYARDHGMAVLLANYSGPSGGYVSAGRSAFWAPGGRCVAAAPDDAPGVVWAQRSSQDEWTGGVLGVALSA
ncbi:carbon-nitrogen hydrolase family protein [Paracidovorax sp. MALMAid1276]|uniref:carbon-nitrogen hydrolase family protein n=1 Tax=Paracidovorax sp. MALMAid1276 TaxID=3411631 RepID=UPI003B997920